MKIWNAPTVPFLAETGFCFYDLEPMLGIMLHRQPCDRIGQHIQRRAYPGKPIGIPLLTWNWTNPGCHIRTHTLSLCDLGWWKRSLFLQRPVENQATHTLGITQTDTCQAIVTRAMPFRRQPGRQRIPRAGCHPDRCGGQVWRAQGQKETLRSFE